MKNLISQLILNFELQNNADYTNAAFRENKALLKLFTSEREYFDARKTSEGGFEVEMPQAFQETALMDPKGWRNNMQTAWQAAQGLGNKMWFNLPESLRETIFSSNINNPLRVAVASHSNGLDDIPWEWLNKNTGSAIATLDAIRFVRLVPTLYAVPPLSITPPVRVLIVLTNPKDERLLQPNVEIDVIAGNLYNLPEYEVRVAMEPRREALLEEMEWLPNIIHYVGHAGISGNKGCLIIHDEREGTRWLPADEAAKFIPSSVRLVCLSTCVTAENYQIGGLNKFAHCPADVSLPTAIVNQYALEPAAAKSFWGDFYRSLIKHDGNVAEAFHESRRNLQESEIDKWNWASFSLVVRDGTGHPFRISQTPEKNQDLFATEIQAQWSARLANNLAGRASTLDSKYQKHWETSIAEESSRLENFETEIDKKGEFKNEV